MRNTLLIAALAAAVPMEARAAAPEAAVTVPLTFRAFESPREMMDLTWGGEEVPFEAQGPAFKKFSHPPVAGKASFFRIRLPWMRGRLVGAAGRSAPGRSAPDRLWLDWNGDLKLDAAEEYAAEGEGGLALFRPAREPDEKRSRFQVLLHDGDHLHVVPSGCYEGEVAVEGGAVRLGLVDRNQDLALDGKSAETEDLCLLDVNGDGSFQGAAEGWMARPWELEALPLRRLLQMPDGSFRRLTAAGDGRSLTLDADTRPAGRLRAACPHFALEVEGGGESFWVRGRNGEATLPAGTYDLNWATLGTPDAEGKVWSAAMLPSDEVGERPGELKVTADAESELTLGPPFRLHLDVEARGRARNFRVHLKDGRGNPVAELYAPDGRRPAPPEIRMLDGQGKSLAVMNAAYGDGLTCTRSWTPAAGMPAKVTARAEWALGPFETPPVERSVTSRSYGRRRRR